MINTAPELHRFLLGNQRVVLSLCLYNIYEMFQMKYPQDKFIGVETIKQSKKC